MVREAHSVVTEGGAVVNSPHGQPSSGAYEHVCSHMTVNTTDNQIPRMLATVRNRRGTIAGVDPFDGEAGRLHLVHLEYQDHGTPSDERLIWELEPRRTLLAPTALPDSQADPMPAADFDALVRAARWTALSARWRTGSGPRSWPRPTPVRRWSSTARRAARSSKSSPGAIWRSWMKIYANCVLFGDDGSDGWGIVHRCPAAPLSTRSFGSGFPRRNDGWECFRARVSELVSV